jgi:hypothetical protein
MLICDSLAFGVLTGNALRPVKGMCPGPVSTPGAFERRASVFGKGGLSGPAIFREMNGVLEGK